MSREVWKTIEAKAREVRIAETKRERGQRDRKFGMKKKKQQSQKKKQRNWYQSDFTSGSIFLKRNKVRGCQ